MATTFIDDNQVAWAVEWKTEKTDPRGWLVFRSEHGERKARCEQHVGTGVQSGSNDPLLMEMLRRCFLDSVPVSR